MIGVSSDHPAFLEVLGQLRLSAQAVGQPADSIVAIAGDDGWSNRLRNALAAGASVVVVDDPQSESREVLGEHDGCSAAVVVNRPRLRPDVTRAALESRASAPVRAIVIEATGASSEVAGLLRDAVGWGRTFGEGPLTLRGAHATPACTAAWLESRNGVGVSVCVSQLTSPVGGGFIRVVALGETRSEVIVDRVSGATSVTAFTARGAFVAASHFESPIRLALRRAIEAVAARGSDGEALLLDASAGSGDASGPAPAPSIVLDGLTDLAEFRHDAALADQITHDAHHSR